MDYKATYLVRHWINLQKSTTVKIIVQIVKIISIIGIYLYTNIIIFM